MKTIVRYSLFVLFGLSLFSCSKSYTVFTQKMYDEFDWTEDELRAIQFYLTDDIVLRRGLSGSESKISEGKIRTIDGRKMEEVVFKKGTPGVLLFTPKTNRFAISFEEGEDKFLIFGPSKRSASGKYLLRGKSWGKKYGEVTYNGKVYKTTSESAFAGLAVDLKRARKVSYKSKTVGGRKIG